MIKCPYCNGETINTIEEYFGTVVECLDCRRETIFDYCHKTNSGNGIPNEANDIAKEDLHEKLNDRETIN